MVVVKEVKSFIVSEGSLLWTPPESWIKSANITNYIQWLNQIKGLNFRTYDELWQWSVTDIKQFWSSISEFFKIQFHKPYTQILSGQKMPKVNWFLGAELNYAEHALSRRDEHTAIMFQSERHPLSELTYAQLYRQVASVSASLRQLGVQKGDRIAAYLPNIPQTVIAFLATASIGAIWSSCSPDFGTRSVLDRFQQIEPKVLFAIDGYQYNGKKFDRISDLSEIQKGLPSLQRLVLIPYLNERPDVRSLENVIIWDDLLGEDKTLTFEPVAFEHPLWILYSSGTTGLPKAIVHGHGGMLLEHYKCLALHWDLTENDRFFWFTTTGWMMWNFLIGGLLLGSTILLYDGSPSYPDMLTLWKFAEATKMNYFGTSAPYIHACMKEKIEPNRQVNLNAIRMVGSTGAPLSPEGFKWVYDFVKEDVLLGSFSGGTDMCTGFVGPCPLLKVYAGEIQCRCLGAKVEAYDENANSVIDEVGELVITQPMPCMPIFFWNDPDGKRYQESYFEFFEGAWRHGDWIKITQRGSCVIYGRSDSTIKRGGVRMGTSEFYRVIEGIPEIVDSLVVDTSQLGREGKLFLFVVLNEGVHLTENLTSKIKQKIKTELSPRHVPDEIYSIAEVPRTLNAKKLEVPVKRILLGTPVEKAVNIGSVINPQSIFFFEKLAQRLLSDDG